MKKTINFLCLTFISNIKLILVNIVILFLLFEISSRLYLSLRRESKFLDPSRVTEFYYPELKSSRKNPTTQTEHHILLLGASVLNPSWGTVEEEIRNALKEVTTKPFVIHNMGMPSHTSRDSLIKYKLLKGNHFDKVLVYHGINEIRMNNYSENRYKHDYSHIHWYRIVDPITQYPELSYYATPFMIQHTWFKLTTRDNDQEFENKKYGSKIKTAISLSSNLNAIADIAKARHENLILCTFATHIPPNYSQEQFNDHKLDYDKHLLPVEAWGFAENVKKTMSVHNKVIQGVAKAQGVTCIDFATLIPKSKATFDDPCHLTNQGSRIFARSIVSELLP